VALGLALKKFSARDGRGKWLKIQGRGRIINRLAELYSKSRFTGVDLSTEVTLLAWKEAADKKLRNVELIVGDAE
jgi:tRNA G46 methylase TrmB